MPIKKNHQKGQASVEYILMTAAIVFGAVMFGKIFAPKFEAYMGTQADQMSRFGRGGGFENQKTYYYKSFATKKERAAP